MQIVEQRILTRILAAVGGSEASLSALAYALDLAQAVGEIPEVLIVEEKLITPEMVLARGEALGRLADRLAAAVEMSVDETEDLVRAHATRHGWSVEIARSTGRVGDCVVAAAQNASLLVLGHQGHRVNRSGLLGSNTESIVRRTHRPLLITPNGHRRVRRVLAAYSGKDLGELALAKGCEIAVALDVPLDVLTIAQTPEDGAAIQEQARQALGSSGPAATFSLQNGDPASGIIARCTSETLVAMGAYGHARLYPMVLGSVTEQVLRFARGPVLLSSKQAPTTSM